MTSTYKAPDLAKLAIEAHGGLERWKRFTTLSVHGVNGGVLWGAKGKAGVLDDVTITVDLRNEKASHWPFGSPDRRSRFEPQRVALENANGEVLEELLQPRSSFKGHSLETPWNDLQLAYFAGCAMWTYLNTPFLLVRPGVESEEIEPWQEAGEAAAVRLDIHERELRVGLRVLRDATGEIVGQIFISDSLENGAGYSSYFGNPSEAESLLR